jgi:adenylylsulfate kinase-like enzyme
MLPGVQAAYEPPLAPGIVVHGAVGAPADSAQEIVAFLAERHWI